MVESRNYIISRLSMISIFEEMERESDKYIDIFESHQHRDGNSLIDIWKK